MAKKRRSYAITTDTYSVGGGGGSGANMVFWKGTGTSVAIKSNFLKDKQELTAMSDINVAGPTVSFSWDHSFDNARPSITATLVGSLPAGISHNIDVDGSSDDSGYVTVSGTPTAAAGDYKWSYTITDPHDDSVFTVKFKYTIAPSGTTTAWSSTAIPNKFIRNTVAAQYLTVAPTTTYAGVSYSLANVVNPHAGYTLKINAAGRVYVDNTPNTVLSAQTVSFDVVADLGEYGTSTQSFSGSVSTGDPYGSRYFGPANAYREYFYGDHRADADATKKDGSYWHRTNANSGAINFITDANRSSTPYRGGLQPTDSNPTQFITQGMGGIGNATSNTNYLAANYQGYFSTAQQGAGQVYKWYAPAGITQFSVVAVGAGGPGAYNWSDRGGGGGGLAYLNGITCTAGEEFWVQIGTPMYHVTNNNQWYSGDSFMMRASGSEYLVIGWGGGHYSNRATPPQGWIGTNRNNSASAPGGMTHAQNAQNNTQSDPGAASYNNSYGSGGAFYSGWSTSYGHGGAGGAWRGNGAGGSQASAGSSSGGPMNGQDYSSTWGGSGGGGVGLDGNGKGVSAFGYQYGSSDPDAANGYSSIGSHGYRFGGGGGSGGSRGDWGENPYTGRGHFEGTNYAASGGTHGGGGGGSATSTPAGGRGGCGGVRIIWGDVGGTQRAYPNTYTTENPAINGQS